MDIKFSLKIYLLLGVGVLVCNLGNAQIVTELNEVDLGVIDNHQSNEDWLEENYGLDAWLDYLNGYEEEEGEDDPFYDYEYNYGSDSGSSSSNSDSTTNNTDTSSNNNSTALQSAIDQEFGFYSNKELMKIPAMEVRTKVMSVGEVEMAGISLQVVTMPSVQLEGLVSLYNSTLNDNSLAVDLSTIQLENEAYVADNNTPSSKTIEFNNWVSDILFIQMSARYNYVEVYDCYNYSNSCSSDENENDDFSGFAQQHSFFNNNPDDPWRLKQYLSPDSYYTTGLLAGLGDGIIETGDMVYTLGEYVIKNSAPVLIYNLITDFEGTLQAELDKLEMAQALIELISDPVKQEQIINKIEQEIGTWFDQVTGKKTWAEMGYQHGKLLFEVLSALVGVAEVKALIKTGQFGATALSAINAMKGVFAKGFKYVKINGVTKIVDNLGVVLTEGVENVKSFTHKLNEIIRDNSLGLDGNDVGDLLKSPSLKTDSATGLPLKWDNAEAVLDGIKRTSDSGVDGITISHKKFPQPADGSDSYVLNNAKQYQSEASGDAGLSFNKGGKSFDNVTEDGILVDRKYGHGSSVFNPDGSVHNSSRAQSILQQGFDQINAANGAPVRWEVSTELGADGIQQLFDNASIDIEVIHVPQITIIN